MAADLPAKKFWLRNYPPAKVRIALKKAGVPLGTSARILRRQMKKKKTKAW